MEPIDVLSRYLIGAVLLLAVSFATFRVFVRRDYLRRGRLGPFPYLLQLVTWFLFYVFPYLYNPSGWAWFWLYDPPAGPTVRALAVACITLGVIIIAAGMMRLGMDRTMGQDAGRLETSGPYRFTRNPQILGGFPAVVGLAMLWPSWYAAGWIALYATIGHMMVLTEEEHLRRSLGQRYRAYCDGIPRYLGPMRRP